MIKLDVEDYCSDCPNFKPGTSKSTDYDGNGEFVEHSTIIFCKHERNCIEIRKYLEKRDELK